MSSEESLGVFWRGFSHLFGLQLGSRALTFLLNVIVTRRISPSVYGLAAFRLPLLNESVLMLSREACRRSCLRKDPSARQSPQQEFRSVLPFTLLPIPLGIFGLLLFFLYFVWDDESSTVSTSLILEHMVAVGIELMSEPLYILASVWLEFRLRAMVEGTAVFMKSCTTFLLLSGTSRRPEMAFADAQIVYALCLLCGYATLLPRAIALLRSSERQEKDKQPSQNQFLARLRLSAVFQIQTIEKWILAAGSKMVLVGTRSLHVEGVYGLVDNLGSLVVRVVFQPFEEAAFTAFSRTGTSKSASGMNRTAETLTALIRCVFLIGFMAIVFGPPSAHLALQPIYSSKWSDTEAPFVLACYCPYIALMSLNGICEAFVHAVLDAGGLWQSNLFMLFSASLHVACSMVLVQMYGAVGLVAADGMNMCVRILFSLMCIKRHFGSVARFKVAALFPTTTTMLSGVAVHLLLVFAHSMCQRIFDQFVQHLSAYGLVVLVCLGFMGWIVWRMEQKAWRALIQIRGGGAVAKQD